MRLEGVLAPLFAKMSEEHPRYVAHFVAEVPWLNPMGCGSAIR